MSSDDNRTAQRKTIFLIFQPKHMGNGKMHLIFSAHILSIKLTRERERERERERVRERERERERERVQMH